MLIISACLVGINCRYDGGCFFNKKAIDLVKKGKAIPICPEVLGGLDIPRDCCEIKVDEYGNKKIFSNKGRDCTSEFMEGAQKALAVAKAVGAKKAVLKSRSPSCGCGLIYDGTFSGNLKEGKGFTAELFCQHNISVLNEDELAQIKI